MLTLKSYSDLALACYCYSMFESASKLQNNIGSQLMKKLYLTLGFLMCFTSQIHAGDYAIQLSATKTPALSQFASLEEFGNLYTTNADNGLIRTRLGPFYGKEKALEALAKVHTAGFQNAILVNADTNSNINNTVTTNSENYLQDSVEWQSLDSKQQANVVNLDGVLHIKEGDNFTPLSKVLGK